ncbi:hypothetical protein K469DRAFT_692013 [Zopfia rhizophila CBS 207.26]|uniref:Uncharacterized protein n=1 Tax=Zopfia rhizophila CBS 207.26 TaxID=1314779 RepID=A0A6A6DPW5_9PEZI|nr:hypothetical protein K469DRAFT_692013 [Zopfia rhizophila CBS 207.26]
MNQQIQILKHPNRRQHARPFSATDKDKQANGTAEDAINELVPLTRTTPPPIQKQEKELRDLITKRRLLPMKHPTWADCMQKEKDVAGRTRALVNPQLVLNAVEPVGLDDQAWNSFELINLVLKANRKHSSL